MDFKKESLEELKREKILAEKDFYADSCKANEIRDYLSGWNYYGKLAENYEGLNENLGWEEIFRKTKIKILAKESKEKYMKLFIREINGFHNNLEN